MLIATLNVNGIRAASRKGLDQWLDQCQPDVLLLQEVRADEEIATSLLPGYQSVIWPCRIKGRAGVGVAVREGSGVSIAQTRTGVAPQGQDEPDVDSGRWLEADLTREDGGEVLLTVVSAYLHSGQVGTEKMDQKYAHLAQVDERMAQLMERAQTQGIPALMAGDLNIVHTERDIKNWKPNHNKVAGVLDEEIAHLDTWAGQGWVDITRQLSGDCQGPYTWWSMRGKAFDNDAGWRIDYQLVTPDLAQSATAVRVDRAPSYAERVSDHAPLVVTYELD